MDREKRERFREFCRWMGRKEREKVRDCRYGPEIESSR